MTKIVEINRCIDYPHYEPNKSCYHSDVVILPSQGIVPKSLGDVFFDPYSASIPDWCLLTDKPEEVRT